MTVNKECGAVDALDNRKKHDSLAAKRTVSESERTAEGERRSNPSSGRPWQGRRAARRVEPIVVGNVHAPEERAV